MGEESRGTVDVRLCKSNSSTLPRRSPCTLRTLLKQQLIYKYLQVVTVHSISKYMYRSSHFDHIGWPFIIKNPHSYTYRRVIRSRSGCDHHTECPSTLSCRTTWRVGFEPPPEDGLPSLLTYLSIRSRSCTIGHDMCCASTSQKHTLNYMYWDSGMASRIHGHGVRVYMRDALVPPGP